MLIGKPGTKKSSAIKIGAKLMKQAGYKTFAAKKTRQEKYLLDLAEQSTKLDTARGGDGMEAHIDAILDANLFGEFNENDPESYLDKPAAESFIAADEFNNFIGIGNLDFASILGELWDYEGVFDYKLKNSDSIYIPHPTVTILGGNTPTGFATAFPVEAIGQGFFSRVILVHAEPSGVLYTFPPPPDTELQDRLVTLLKDIKEQVRGEIVMTDEASALLHNIYHGWSPIDDVRFEHYANRRLTHLLKVCLVMVASRIGTQMTVKDVVAANTLLTHTENLMPKALGEFGKSKHSAIANKVMDIVYSTDTPIRFKALWKLVHQDLDNRQQLVEIINNLQVAEKIQSIGSDGYLPIKKQRDSGVAGAIDWNLLTKEERDL